MVVWNGGMDWWYGLVVWIGGTDLAAGMEAGMAILIPIWLINTSSTTFEQRQRQPRPFPPPDGLQLFSLLRCQHLQICRGKRLISL